MRVSFYEKDITPPLGCYLPGYYINHVAVDVLDTLHVRSAVFENDGEVAVVVSIDSCEMPDDLHDAVAERITAYTGIPEERILLCANHTHKGIPVFDSPEIDAYADPEFKSVVYRLIADCVTLAYRRLENGTVYYAAGKAEGVSFCRNFIAKDGTYFTWATAECLGPLSTVDTEVPFLFVKDEEGKPRGAVVNFACHQDCLPGSVYTGDFSHVLSEELKKTYGQEFVTVFLLGTCGDINHIDPSKESMPFDTYRKIGKLLANTVVEHADSADLVGNIVKVAKKRFAVRRRVLTDEEAFAEMTQFAKEKKMFSIRNLAFYHACVKKPETEVWLQCIRIGDVMLYGYPGEVFVNFGLDLKKRSPFDKNLVGTLCNTGCGYIATQEAHSEKSHLYERDLCVGACLEKEEGYRITDELLFMAKSLM